MQILIILGFIGFATLIVFGLGDVIKQINKIKDEKN